MVSLLALVPAAPAEARFDDPDLGQLGRLHL